MGISVSQLKVLRKVAKRKNHPRRKFYPKQVARPEYCRTTPTPARVFDAADMTAALSLMNTLGCRFTAAKKMVLEKKYPRP